MAQEVEQVQATPAVQTAAKPSQPPVEGVKWYKKWQVWLIIAVVIIGAGAGVYFWLA